MYLKRLELYGFKSFREKTVLEFGGGVTAVVGPNGSGKSNIADAVRWALGEQSAKSLRGQKMEDVIFSGTENRRGVALAEVTLVLDNEGGELRLGSDAPEVAVSRRVYRSGESQYLINGASVRLKDVHGLFMDTGLGREGYSIIGQGRIEDVLSVKSEDRRAIFEEAAGIVKYKARRSEAEAKLEKERQSAERARDIIAELEARLGPSAEMAEKAKRYLELMERLKLVRVNVFQRMLESHGEEDRQANERIEGLNADIEAAVQDIETQKAETAALREQAAQLAETSALYRDKSGGLAVEIEKTEGEIKLAGAQAAHCDERAARLLADIREREETAETAGAEKLELLDKQLRLAEEMLEKDEAASELKQELETKSRELLESETGLERFNAMHIESLEGVTNAKSRVEGLIAAYAALEDAKERAGEELAEAEASLKAARTAYAETEEAMRGTESETQEMSELLGRLTESKERLDKDYTELKTAFKSESARLAEARTRHRLLEELEAGYEGYQYSVKNLLTAARAGKVGTKGLRGAVGELITVPARYETCIEAALGGAIADVVAEDEEAAKRGIEYLKASKSGRATFLPMTAVKARTLGGEKDRLCASPGILGAASDLIGCDEEYRGIIENLLGRVLVAEDIDRAVEFSRKYKYAYKVATLSGEVINPGGAITGGYMGKSAGLLERRRKLQELAGEIREADRLAAKRNAELDAASGKLSAVAFNLEKTKMTFHEMKIKESRLEADFAQAARVVKEREARLEALSKRDADLLARLEAANAELRESRNRQKAVETDVSGLLEEIAGRQENLVMLRKRRDELAKRINAAEVELSRLAETVVSAENGVARAEAAMKAATDAAEGLQNEKKALDKEKEAKLAEIEALRVHGLSLAKDKEKLDKEAEGLAAHASKLEAELREQTEKELEAARFESRLRLELERLNSKQEALESERNRLYDEMWEEYNITPQGALDYEKLELPPARLKQEETALKNELRAMGGTVNVGAVEEYRLLKERHAFLSKQREDILLAEEGLAEVIAELNGLMKARFMEQFSVISDNFGTVFTEMFGGGVGSLKLTDENDPLGSGIEIIAKPPGKALQSMSLLSGGERALCAITLLFAILRMKPSPFCILDEIETALDDANVRRFGQFIKHYSGGTQFIVITHRKGTMEAADTLYGVTMQEAGISKLVSVKFTEEEVEAS